MKHYTEDDLVLHHYGESDESTAIGRHLASCASCHTDYLTLQGTLALVDDFDRSTSSERDRLYGRQVWARLSAKLEPRHVGRRGRWSPPRLAAIGSIAAALLLAFVGGLLVGRQGEITPEGGAIVVNDAAPQRILLIAVGEHLDRSQRLLIELVNESAAGSDVDLSRHRERAATLASSNRVYRRGAVDAGDLLVADVLEQLERTLLEIAHAPREAAEDDLEQLRRRIERRGILMKIRVLGGAEPEKRQPRRVSGDPGRQAT
jgi:hypothetical protein